MGTIEAHPMPLCYILHSISSVIVIFYLCCDTSPLQKSMKTKQQACLKIAYVLYYTTSSLLNYKIL